MQEVVCHVMTALKETDHSSSVEILRVNYACLRMSTCKQAPLLNFKPVLLAEPLLKAQAVTTTLLLHTYYLHKVHRNKGTTPHRWFDFETNSP